MLQQGINKVVIKAKNDYGRDSSSRVIAYKVPTLPQVDIIDPSTRHPLYSRSNLQC